jgi:hypothetical protein
VLRGIALHDEGWTTLDDEMLSGRRAPISFVHAAVEDFVSAWTDSIRAASLDSTVGGIMVSRHFCRLARPRAGSDQDTPGDRQRLKDFLTSESEHQARLMHQQEHTEEEIERFTDVLQFCDALSLYLCCGAEDDVQFPQDLGAGHVIARRTPETLNFETSPFSRRFELRVKLTAADQTACTAAYALE